MKSKLIKAIIAGILIIGIGTGGFFGYKNLTKKNVVLASTKYSTSTVKKMNLSKSIQGTGSAYAGTAKDVAPNNNGTLSSLTVKVSDTVTAGQTLFVSSSSELTRAVTTATRNLTKAEDQLDTDESAEKVDDAKVTEDEYAVEDAEDALTDAKTAAAAQTVTSPIAGTVTAVNASNGDSGQPGTSIVTVTDMTTMKVKVSVDELDIASVKIGQKATITFDALSDKTFTGTVEAISQTGTTSNNVTTYDVTVSITKPSGIRLGMNANVTIAIESKDNALVIPEEALVEVNNKTYVRVQEDSTSSTSSTSSAQSNSGQNNSNTSSAASNGKLVEITTGLETENYIEVTKGLTEGETILVQLPSSSSTTTNTRGMGGFGGEMGGMPSGGFDRQAGTSGGASGGTSGGTSNSKPSN